MSSDPVPAITEAAARGETAVIFADLRATLGVNVVNLIWRHIATFPGALAWAWATVKPIYVSGRVGIEARQIRAGLTLPGLPPWPRSLLRSAGIDASGEASIRRILSSYNRSNAMNLVALSALVRRIDGGSVETQSDRIAQDTPPEAPVEGGLPKLLALDEVSPDVADLIRSINLLGDRAEGRIIASMYRHVAHWPGFLALCYVHLAPYAFDRRLENMSDQVIALGERAGARLHAGTAVLPPPDTADEVRRAAADFLQNAIGKMVPIAALLMASLPQQGPGASPDP